MLIELQYHVFYIGNNSSILTSRHIAGSWRTVPSNSASFPVVANSRSLSAYELVISTTPGTTSNALLFCESADGNIRVLNGSLGPPCVHCSAARIDFVWSWNDISASLFNETDALSYSLNSPFGGTYNQTFNSEGPRYDSKLTMAFWDSTSKASPIRHISLI